MLHHPLLLAKKTNKLESHDEKNYLSLKITEMYKKSLKLTPQQRKMGTGDDSQ